MKKHFWKLEYSLTLIAIVSVVLMLIPTDFLPSNVVGYTFMWNSTLHNIAYIFDTMNAQAESDILKGLKNASTKQEKEKMMLNLVQPYFRVSQYPMDNHYVTKYLNDTVVEKNSKYYFDKLYIAENGKILGIKEVENSKVIFMLMFDMNGLKQPNTWGKDIFGVDVFYNSKISPFGEGLSEELLKQDCSPNGRGVYCSQYYRIGGEVNE